jgi:hypothetical protein
MYQKSRRESCQQQENLSTTESCILFLLKVNPLPMLIEYTSYVKYGRVTAVINLPPIAERRGGCSLMSCPGRCVCVCVCVCVWDVVPDRVGDLASPYD